MIKWDYNEVNDKDRLIVFIGESKKDKYLLKFGIGVYDESYTHLPRLPKISWNWSAFFAGVLWMGYRKMYLELIVYSTLSLLFSLIIPDINDNIDAILTALSWIFFGLITNSLYFFSCKRKITRVKNLNLSHYDELEALKQKGGTSVAGIFISILTVIIQIIIYLMIRFNFY
ncbi:DUF2628 domain-containing protein [Pseudoneobacillus sp. C159]